ncbi:hypothetical protein D3C81_2143390 [compost metagenome]
MLLSWWLSCHFSWSANAVFSSSRCSRLMRSRSVLSVALLSVIKALLTMPPPRDVDVKLEASLRTRVSTSSW